MRKRLRLSLLFWGLVLLAASWTVGIEPRWVAQREVDHVVPQWAGSPGMKVAVAGDWHIGKRPLVSVMTVDRANAIVDEINAALPDVILLPGDFIAEKDFEEGSAEAAEEVAAVLGRLRAPLGVFAVLGNHEWWHNGPAFAAALQRRGIRVLENEAAPVDAGVWVVGIGDHSTGHARAREAFAALPQRAQALVMMHDPAALPDLPTVQGLIVAAHTHGGQVALPFLGALITPGDSPREWAYGWIKHQDNSMYVTSGLGVSILPVRLNRRPEWVLFRIGRAIG